MTATETIKLDSYLIEQFGQDRIISTLEAILELSGKRSGESITKYEFMLLIYCLFTGYNTDLGSIQDRIEAFTSVPRLAEALEKVFSGKVEADQIVFDLLAGGDVYIFFKNEENKISVFDYHTPGEKSMKDFDIAGSATSAFLKSLTKIYQKL